MLSTPVTINPGHGFEVLTPANTLFPVAKDLAMYGESPGLSRRRNSISVCETPSRKRLDRKPRKPRLLHIKSDSASSTSVSSSATTSGSTTPTSGQVTPTFQVGFEVL